MTCGCKVVLCAQRHPATKNNTSLAGPMQRAWYLNSSSSLRKVISHCPLHAAQMTTPQTVCVCVCVCVCVSVCLCVCHTKVIADGEG